MREEGRTVKGKQTRENRQGKTLMKVAETVVTDAVRNEAAPVGLRHAGRSTTYHQRSSCLGSGHLQALQWSRDFEHVRP